MQGTLYLCFAAAACLVAVHFSNRVPSGAEEATVIDADAERLWLLQTTSEVVERRSQASGSKQAGKHPALVQQAPNTTVNASNPGGNAEAVGVTLNAAGDLDAFTSALIMYPGACCVLIAFFMFASRRYPAIYSNNVKEGWAPGKIPDGMFGWAHASLGTTIEEFAEHVGVDMAMLMQYTQLCMKILAFIGIPMCCIFGPLNYIFGGFAAGDDYLSYFSFGNVQNGKWHYTMYAFVVWYVVFVVQYFAFQAQEKFLDIRYNWLKNLSEPRGSTVLVENIPGKYQSDEKLRHFFDSLFTKGSIASAFVVKDTSALVAAEKQQDSIAFKLMEAEAGGEGSVGASMKTELEAQLDAATAKVAELRAKVLKDAEKTGGVNLSNGFVTFTSRRDALVAENLTFGTAYDEMVVSVPPPVSSVIWKDLQTGANSTAGWTLLGYGLIVGLYAVYLPLTIWMTNLAVNFNMGPFQSQWQAVAPTMGIQIMVAFLPTILLLIFRCCFVLKDDAWAQLRLQNSYFMFQVVFVILIVAISSDAVEFAERVFTHPTDLPVMLGQTMPYATHFYMNFMVLQWMTHSMNLTRYIQLIKFMIFKAVFDEDKAREMSEPEDQDYYGIGSRSARFSTNMLVCIIFGTLCPWMSLLGFVNFFICRLYYGYLTGFAENKKPDLGGLFWVQQLRNFFVGLVIYVVMMTGVLYSRAASGVPAIISAVSIVFVFLRYRRFEEAFVWDRLPFEVVVNETLEKKQGEEGMYIQPELMEPEEREKIQKKMGLASAFATYAAARRAQRKA